MVIFQTPCIQKLTQSWIRTSLTMLRIGMSQNYQCNSYVADIQVYTQHMQQTYTPLSLSLGRRSLAAALFDGTLVSREVSRWRVRAWLVDVCWSLWFLSDPVKGSLMFSSVLAPSLGLPKVHTYELAK